MPPPTKLLAFVRLLRAKFLVGGFAAFALGAAVARFDGFTIGWAAYVHGQLMVLGFHAMVHFANDYYDRECDVHAERTPWSGGSGVLVDGSLSPRTALIASLACAAIGVVSLAGFVATGAYAVAAIGAAIAILAWFYSAPPLRLLARGLGELDTVVIIAILFPLAGYATFAGTIGSRVLLSALPLAAAMFVLMFCVEYPDIDADRLTGKLNLVVRAGPLRSRFFVYAAVLGAYVATAVAVFCGAASTLALFSLLTLPLAWGLVEQLAREEFAGGPLAGDVAARGVAFFVATAFGSLLAYVAVM